MGAPGVTASRRGATKVPDYMAGVTDAATFIRLNMFPTPPWATRALTRIVVPRMNVGPIVDAWEPACGLGHMASVLRETIPVVTASDIHRYAPDQETVDFTAMRGEYRGDWIITNPPFDRATDFISNGLRYASSGIAILARLSLLEGEQRYDKLWTRTPPRIIAPFSERLSMCCGGWDPDLDGATAHAWSIWTRDAEGAWPTPIEVGCGRVELIPPGCERSLTRLEDARMRALHLPGWIAPSTIAHRDNRQLSLLDIASAA